MLDQRSGNRRSVHYATPEFLWSLVALANFVRLSLRKAAHAVLSKVVQHEIRVRSVENHCPQRLKPHQFCLLYVRAEARTLQPIFMHLDGPWACGPSQGMKMAFVHQPLSMEASPSPLSSRPERTRI